MRSFLVVIHSFFVLGSCFAQPKIILEPFISGLDLPVDIAYASSDDSNLYIVEKPGRILVARSDGNLESTPFLDIRGIVRSSFSEQGLLGLVFHPNYSSNGFFYVHYTTSVASSRIARFTRDVSNPLIADPNSEKEILTIPQDFANHNGGDLAFGQDGYLYIAMGDGGSGDDPNNRGQTKSSLLGKILRIDVDNGDPYAIPADNPFVNDASARNEIWTWGWRNPWRFSFDRLNGDMWVADVGQVRFEEISVQAGDSQGGENFGWRCYEGDRFNTDVNTTNCPDLSTLVPPVFTYPQPTGKSVTGGFVYRGTKYPDLVGHYVFGDYKTGRFWTLFKKEDGSYGVTEQGLLMGTDQVSTFGEDGDGEMYVAAYLEGKIFKVTLDSSTSVDPPSYQVAQAIPNPMYTSTRILFDNPNSSPYTLNLYDISGQRIRSQTDIRGGEVEIWRENLAAGVYMIELDGERPYAAKLIVLD